MHRNALRGEESARGPTAVPPDREPTREDIDAALTKTGGKIRSAAQMLHIDRRKLYRLCERFAIDLEAYRGGTGNREGS